jgi:hypothetical protein
VHIVDWESDAQDVRADRDDWVPDAQRWINQINGVLQCKIDLDPAGEITGVHVVAGMDREPRHIVRDVEGLLKARLGMDVYYKKIGVVQVMNTEADAAPAAAEGGVTFHGPGAEAEVADPPPAVGEPAAEAPSPPASGQPASPAVAGDPSPPIPAVLVAEDFTPRILCSGVGVMVSDLTVRAEVVLKTGGLESRGVSEGPNAGSDLVLIARAALEAVGGLLAERLILGLNEVRLGTLGGQPVVMAAVDLVEGRRSETLVGTCAVGHNQAQAVVHAILDALNRRLALYALKEEGGD